MLRIKIKKHRRENQVPRNGFLSSISYDGKNLVTMVVLWFFMYYRSVLTSNNIHPSTSIHQYSLQGRKILHLYWMILRRSKEIWILEIFIGRNIVFTICKNAWTYRCEVTVVWRTSALRWELLILHRVASGTILKVILCWEDHMGTINSVWWQYCPCACNSILSFMIMADNLALSFIILWIHCVIVLWVLPVGKIAKCCLFLSLGKLHLLQNN